MLGDEGLEKFIIVGSCLWAQVSVVKVKSIKTSKQNHFQNHPSPPKLDDVNVPSDLSAQPSQSTKQISQLPQSNQSPTSSSSSQSHSSACNMARHSPFTPFPAGLPDLSIALIVIFDSCWCVGGVGK